MKWCITKSLTCVTIVPTGSQPNISTARIPILRREEALGVVEYRPGIDLFHDPLQLLSVCRVVPGVGLVPAQLRIDVIRVTHETAIRHLHNKSVSVNEVGYWRRKTYRVSDGLEDASDERDTVARIRQGRTVSEDLQHKHPFS